MTPEIDEVTKPRCSSPVKIIKAASKARAAGFAQSSSFSNSNTEMYSDKGNGNMNNLHGCRRKLSPPDSPSRHANKETGSLSPIKNFHRDNGNGSTNQRPRISKSANQDESDSNEHKPGQG